MMKDSLSTIGLDLRYAVRMMIKSPGLTSVLVVTLALGIGASTTIFSVVSSVILRPLPFHEPDRLVRIYTGFDNGQVQLREFPLSPPEYKDLADGCRTCQSVAAWARGTASLSGGERPTRIDATFATHTLLPMLGVQPLLGRFFDASEDVPGDYTVILLGYDVWQRAFDGDPAIIGRTIRMDAMPVTVIGVMPKGFDFIDRAEAWMPLNVDYTKANRGGHYISTLVRLAPGATLAQFQDELVALSAAWAREAGVPPGPVTKPPPRHTIHEKHTMTAVPFHANLIGSMAKTLWLLQAAVLLVLLISIVNVANLLLARAETRNREVAVRHALGASRRRLVRQFVTESVLLALLGGGLGILVAVWAIDGVTTLIPKAAPRASEITLDGTAVLFAVGCSMFASLLFGLAPILHARKTDLHGALKDGANRMTSSKARLRVRRVLVIVEIALAVVLVVACTVMVRSFLRLQQVELGFNPDRLLTFGLELPVKTYPGTTADASWHRLEERIRALPGVENATLLSGLPPQRLLNANGIDIVGRPDDPSDPCCNVDYWQMVGTNAFETLGARIVRGRGILASDVPESPQVAVINEAFAAKFFPGQDPIGREIIVAERDEPEISPKQTVVGVVADIKQGGVDQPAGTEVFIPVYQWSAINGQQEAQPMMNILVRAKGDPRELIPYLQRVLADLDPTLPMFQTRTMNDVMWEAVARPRFLTFLLGCFAGIALLLAAVGIYGVMAHTVSQRTHEIGLRVALGARPRQVRAMVLRQAGFLVVVGVAIGLAAAVLLEQLVGTSLRALFYGGELSQPVMLGAVALAVTVTALLATWIPVHRATKVQPTVALRSE
ncbi:MAG: ABC transporter permease [Myxococcota bacterium]|nr:ABC transporter permease [Myxococcota bacterium]